MTGADAQSQEAQAPDTQTPDTQWPRWEIFKQDTASKVHQAVGSVHATDPDHALFTARSVFARRPAAVSLWAVREQDISSVTREELDNGGRLPDASGETQPYKIFGKKNHKRSMTFVDELGMLEAASPQAALEAAQSQFGDGLLAWWIIPASAFVGSPEDTETVESWFAPAKDKTYKQQSAYGVVGKHVSERNPKAKA
ncbi:phenylacetic acid degradation protein (plasmid) [Deinococcus psychrotolerans]|uniref:Phenylacetic acid degradation protein n=1 Tax=Deinococcus psychrotolerans TaxID=2489213 RepID=A0A3G8YIA2_9DEIO|nr:phenylacetic acid degradation protein [Deinococcus psychrotolerans]AZI44675.1 phenylacetic acid degradation protein [Deinococcus psychrotolerans]